MAPARVSLTKSRPHVARFLALSLRLVLERMDLAMATALEV